MRHPRAMPLCTEAQAAACRDRIEETIIREYVRLAVTPAQASGLRTITLGQFGALEVRLTELPTMDGSPIPPFWLEIYSHACESVIDSCGCFEFNEHELGNAVELIVDAHRRQPGPN
ncbi:MAG TPA: hypothetical protein VEZ16_02720 [Microvirga sp.]|nr:hypothetical protein [Microvirga sp.]